MPSDDGKSIRRREINAPRVAAARQPAGRFPGGAVLRSADPRRRRLPAAGDGERALSYARRQQHGPADRRGARAVRRREPQHGKFSKAAVEAAKYQLGRNAAFRMVRTLRPEPPPEPPPGADPGATSATTAPGCPARGFGRRHGPVLLRVAIDGVDAKAYARSARWRNTDDGLALLRIALQRTADLFELPGGTSRSPLGKLQFIPGTGRLDSV